VREHVIARRVQETMPNQRFTVLSWIFFFPLEARPPPSPAPSLSANLCPMLLKYPHHSPLQMYPVHAVYLTMSQPALASFLLFSRHRRSAADFQVGCDCLGISLLSTGADARFFVTQCICVCFMLIMHPLQMCVHALQLAVEAEGLSIELGLIMPS
jgi:hypothetical protein